MDDKIKEKEQRYNETCEELRQLLTDVVTNGSMSPECSAKISQLRQEEQLLYDEIKSMKKEYTLEIDKELIVNILTDYGKSTLLKIEDSGNVTIGGENIPKLNFLAQMISFIAKNNEEESKIELTPEFIELISSSDIKLKASNITLEGLVTANENFKILEDGSIVANNGTFTGKIYIGNNGSVIDDSALSNGIRQGAKDGTLAVQKLETVDADIKNLKADKADITDLNATNAVIENLKANKADVQYLTANYATIKQLDATNANVTNLQANKADITDLNATNAEIDNLKADKATVVDLNTANAKIANLETNKADISVLQANYATIKQLNATNANVTSLQTETANINKALIDKADVADLNATNANVTNLQATKANITDLNVAKANINTLTTNLAEITTLVNGNLTSDNIQSMVITGDKFTVADAFIKNAMIDSINASKINAGIINTNNVSIQSNDGSMVLQGNLQQFKDKNGKVRIQIGKDASGNFTFCLYDENGTGQLINQNGIQSSNAIADGLIVDSKVAANANIAGSKLDIDSVVTEVNNGSTNIKGTKIYLDDQNQTLDVAFNNMSTTVSGNTSTINNHTTSINTMNGKVTQLIADTTITKQDGTTTSLKDAYNATVDTVNSHSTKIGSLETNLSTANNNISSVSSKQTALEQNLNGFKQTVSDTYTTKAEFDSLQVGGTNLLLKTKNFDDTVAVDKTGETYRGLTVRGINSIPNTATYICEYGFTDFDYSDIFTFSFYAKGNLTNLCAYFYGDGGYVPAYLIENSVGVKANGSGDGYSPFGKITSEWKRYWVTWQVAGSGNKTIRKRILLRTDGSKVGESIYICGCKFERGNKATEWTPAPQDIDSAISTVDGKFNNYSTTSDMNSAINQKANEITSSVSETYATKASLTTVDNKFANYSTTSAMNTAINQKADSILSTVSNSYATKTALNTVDGKFANYSTTSQMNSAINQKADSILSTVSSTYTTKADFNGLTVGGTNLVPNSNFKKLPTLTGNTANFSYSHAETIENKTSDYGGKLLRIQCFNDHGDMYVFVGNRIKVQANKKYTLSFDYYCSGAFENTGSSSSYMYTFNSSGTQQRILYINHGTINDGVRRRHTQTFTLNENETYIQLRFGFRCTSHAWMCLDGIKFEQGTKNTAWSPAPEDIDSAISTVDGKFASYSTTSQMNSAIDQKANEITSSVSSTYATKVALNTVDGKFANYSTTSAMNSAINQKGDSILSTVSSTYTTKTDFNNLTIGGTNLVTGTRNFDGWSYGGFTLQTSAYDGSFKGCYINWTGTSGYYDVSKNESVYLEPNTEYTLSFWAKGTGKFWSYLYKPSTAVIASGYNSSGDATTSPDGAITTTLTDGRNFKRYWITWKTLSSLAPGKYNIIPCRVAADRGNCHIVICGIKMEKGNRATAWTPAPQDIDNSINAVDAKFANYSTTSQMNSAITQKGNEITSSVSETYATKTSLSSTNSNVSALTTRMSTAENKLTKDSLTTTIGNYYTTSTDVNGLITSKGYATTSQVTQTATDLTAKFTSAGGINLIRNSTAIGELNGWQGNISYSEADSAGRVTGNRRFFYINNKNTTENYAFSPRFALKTNTTYTISCWMYRNTTSTGYDIFVLSSNSLPWTSTSTAYENIYHLHTGSATGWERVEKTFTTGANDISGYVRIDNNGYSGSGDASVANIHFASLMLNEGSVAHPWTPHPSECYSGITQIDSQGIKVYHDSIDGNSYTHMSPSGFYLKNKGTDIFKVNSDGLYLKGNVNATSGTIGGFNISSGKLVGNGGLGVGMSGNGDDWAFWAGSNTGGNAPFHVGHEGNLYATQAYISGTITGSHIEGNTIVGGTIKGVEVTGGVLNVEGQLTANKVVCKDIDSPKYPGVVTEDLKLYVSTAGSDDNELEDGAVFASFDGLLDKLPKNLNGHEVRIEMVTDITENVEFVGCHGGRIKVHMKGHTLNGYANSRMGSARIFFYSGYIGNSTDTSNGRGKIHPNKGYAVGNYTTSVACEDSGSISLYNIDDYGADNYLSGSSNKVGAVAATWGTIYISNVKYYGCDIGARANAGGRVHDAESYGVCAKYGCQSSTGGYITLTKDPHAGGKTANYNESDAGKVIVASGATFATGDVTNPGGTAPVVGNKTVTIKSTSGDTYRSTVYNNYKNDNSVRQGNYGFGNCNGIWLFGDQFDQFKGKNITKVVITIHRQEGGQTASVDLNIKTHNYKTRPSGNPSYVANVGTLGLAANTTGSKTITDTNNTIIAGLKAGTIKGIGLQSTYDSSHYAVCSGLVTIKVTYNG